MARVLLVEDDASLGRTLAERLERDRLVVQWVQSIGEASEQLRPGAWDLAIVDVRLPDGSGFGLARQIKRTTTIPVMFMTALNSAENRLEGFELGADEYLPKPFHLKEFMLRVRHVLATQPPRPVISVGRRVDRLRRDGGVVGGRHAAVHAGPRQPRAAAAHRRRAARRQPLRDSRPRLGRGSISRRSARSTTPSCACGRRSATTRAG